MTEPEKKPEKANPADHLKPYRFKPGKPGGPGRKKKRSIRELLDDIGWDQEKRIAFLMSKLGAKVTQFFQKDGIVTDERDTIDHGIQLKAIQELMKLAGDYEEISKQAKEGEADGIIILGDDGEEITGDPDTAPTSTE